MDSESNNKEQLSKDALIQEAVEMYPEIVPILLEYGLYCVGCYVSAMETLEEGAKGHGMSDDEVENMMADVNETILANKQS